MDSSKYTIQEIDNPYTGEVEIELHSSINGVVLNRRVTTLESHREFRQLVLSTIGITSDNYISITDESKRCDVRIDEGVVYIFPQDQYIDSKESERLGYVWGLNYLNSKIDNRYLPKLPNEAMVLEGTPLYYYNGIFEIKYKGAMKGYVLERTGENPVIALYYQAEDTETQYRTFKRMCKKYLERLENLSFSLKEEDLLYRD